MLATTHRLTAVGDPDQTVADLLTVAAGWPTARLLALRDGLDALVAEHEATLRARLAAIDAVTGGPARRLRLNPLRGRTIAAKYCGPNGETWSGRGTHPAWLRPLLAAGRTVDEFRIPEGE